MPILKTVLDLPLIVLPPESRGNPGPLFAQLYARHGPIFRSRTLDGANVVHVVGPAANRLLMTTMRDNFSNERGWTRTEKTIEIFGKGLTFMDGIEHDLHRRALSPAFTPKFVDQALPIIQRLINDRLNTWESRKVVDIYAEAHQLTMDVSLGILLGIMDVELRREYRSHYLRMFWLEIEALTTVPEPIREEWITTNVRALRAAVKRLLEPMITLQRSSPGDHALGRLCALTGPDMLNDDEIAAEANTLVLAGHITTSSLTAWLMYLLLKHPKYLDRVVTENDQIIGSGGQITSEGLRSMDALENTLKEAERLYPPIADLPRVAVRDTTVFDCLIPAGTLVLCSLAGSHFLPSVFKRPKQFDPDRFSAPRQEHLATPYGLVGFSGGPRICLGITLARVEIMTFVASMLSRYRIKLATGQNVRQIYHPMSTPADGIKILVDARI